MAVEGGGGGAGAAHGGADAESVTMTRRRATLRGRERESGAGIGNLDVVVFFWFLVFGHVDRSAKKALDWKLLFSYLCSARLVFLAQRLYFQCILYTNERVENTIYTATQTKHCCAAGNSNTVATFP